MLLVKKIVRFFLSLFITKEFIKRDYSNYLIFKHFVIQKILRINSHVPWPVHPTSTVSGVRNIKTGYGKTAPGLSPGCYIQGINGIVFGENVLLGPNVGIISANHASKNLNQHVEEKPIYIGNNCWIGMNSVILPGVQLGDNVIVGAGSIVTKSFPSNCVIAGNPAHIIKNVD
ncbi:acyltransferase [Picosynechococcus sp. PCC 11901]|nr:acyltransferase [Picosynechococcus sp. PCC 11901]